MKNKILVTGACGGIGSVLVPFLLEAGFSVLAIDNNSSGDWSNVPDITGLEKKSIDILSSEFEELPWEEFEHVIHLAAISSLPECQSNPLKAFETNVIGTIKTAELSKKSPKLASFINASTSAIYESNKRLPFAETDSVNPHLVYSVTKRTAEMYLEGQRKDQNFPAISLRFFNVFGPMQSYTRKSPPLLNYLVKQAVLNERPILHSSGEQARDYIDVGDICRGILSALKIANSAESGIFNLSSSQLFTVKQVVNVVSQALGKKISPIYRSSEKLWDNYPELVHGSYSINSESVRAETEKVSLGDSSIFSSLTNWEPHQNQEQLMGKRALEAAEVIHNREAINND